MFEEKPQESCYLCKRTRDLDDLRPEMYPMCGLGPKEGVAYRCGSDVRRCGHIYRSNLTHSTITEPASPGGYTTIKRTPYRTPQVKVIEPNPCGEIFLEMGAEILRMARESTDRSVFKLPVNLPRAAPVQRLGRSTLELPGYQQLEDEIWKREGSAIQAVCDCELPFNDYNHDFRWRVRNLSSHLFAGKLSVGFVRRFFKKNKIPWPVLFWNELLLQEPIAFLDPKIHPWSVGQSMTLRDWLKANPGFKPPFPDPT